jgi:hypothetical protein
VLRSSAVHVHVPDQQNWDQRYCSHGWPALSPSGTSQNKPKIISLLSAIVGMQNRPLDLETTQPDVVARSAYGVLPAPQAESCEPMCNTVTTAPFHRLV